ncbi:MAG: hypothetical protein Q9199_008156, partial [Rusavskia elegans]
MNPGYINHFPPSKFLFHKHSSTPSLKHLPTSENFTVVNLFSHYHHPPSDFFKMKFFTTLSPLVLGFVTMSSGIIATPVTGSATEGLAKTDLIERAFEPVVFQDILNLASDLFAIQLVGAQSRLEQLTKLCV